MDWMQLFGIGLVIVGVVSIIVLVVGLFLHPESMNDEPKDKP